MNRPPFRLLGAILLGLLLARSGLRGAPPSPNTESSDGQLDLSLLPRAFQKNPLVDETVVTEFTDAGKKLPPPTTAKPVYYLIDVVGYHAEGQGTDDVAPPPAALLTTCLQRALALNGYLPASPAHPPALLIVYIWGLHAKLDENLNQVDGPHFQDAGHKNLLSRAALVGGSRFAEELRQVLEKQDRADESRLSLPSNQSEMTAVFGPLQLFIQRDAKTRQLYGEALNDCYYAIASAYDYPAAVHGQRLLLWRSKMTADSRGVAMRDTLPGLILNAGKYLGVDMPEAATMFKPLNRDEKVILGPLKVEEYLDQKPPAPPAAAKP